MTLQISSPNTHAGKQLRTILCLLAFPNWALIMHRQAPRLIFQKICRRQKKMAPGG